MSIVGCIDLETSSLNIKKCSITEIGLVIFDTKTKEILGAHDFFVQPFRNAEPISEEASRLTGITDSMVRSRGIPQIKVIATIESACMFHGMPSIQYFVGHNSKNFDEQIFKRYLIEFLATTQDLNSSSHINTVHALGQLPWIDSSIDIPFPSEIITRKLTYLCLEHGYVIPRAHRALFDALGVAHLLSCYDFSIVKQYAAAKDVKLVALGLQKPWEDGGASTGKAKEFGFRFDSATKQWTRSIKDFQVDEFLKQLPFQVQPEQLELPSADSLFPSASSNPTPDQSNQSQSSQDPPF